MDTSRMMNQPIAAEGLVSLEIEGRGKSWAESFFNIGWFNCFIVSHAK